MSSLPDRSERGAEHAGRPVDTARAARRDVQLSREWIALVDAVGRPLIVLAEGGDVLHRSQALVALLSTEPEREAIIAAAVTVVERLRALGDASTGCAWSTAPEITVCPHRRSYTLSPLVAPRGLLAPDAAFVVLVERCARVERMRDADVQKRFGLTEREFQVARLLLAYYSTSEIALALTISSHTARHHVERVLRKAGASGRRDLRKQLALPETAGPAIWQSSNRVY